MSGAWEQYHFSWGFVWSEESVTYHAAVDAPVPEARLVAAEAHAPEGGGAGGGALDS